MKNAILFFALLSLFSCKKNYHSDTAEFIDFKVENQQRSFGPTFAGTGGQFGIEFRGDSIIYINAKPPGVEGIGFYLKRVGVPDGTYELNNITRGYYNYLSEAYITNSILTGFITIKRGVLSGNSRIKIMEGNFTFNAFDSVTNKTIHITNGNYRMKY